MPEEAVEPRRGRGQALTDLTREDLEIYGVEDLKERIELLQGEIMRVEAQLNRKQAGRAAADALFKR
jgi:uncharacterized small protein (DUF1192 family)